MAEDVLGIAIQGAGNVAFAHALSWLKQHARKLFLSAAGPVARNGWQRN